MNTHSPNKKIGRNDLCPCGGGLKFKRCHLGKGVFDKYGNLIPPPGIKEAMERYNSSLDGFPNEKGLLVSRLPLDLEFKGKQIRVAGRHIASRDKRETFHNFVLDFFWEKVLGTEWTNLELQKPIEEQHPMYRWYNELVRTITKVQSPDLPPEHVHEIRLTGGMKTLLNLAYSYYDMHQGNAELSEQFIKRLRHPDQFEGARYELAVASIALRAQFEITWANFGGKKCEFIGKNKITGDIVAFEAKKHIRSAEELEEAALANPRIDVVPHLNKALKQAVQDEPLIFFDDLNLPITPGTELLDKPGFKKAEDNLEKNGVFKAIPKPLAGMFITNFSWHFISGELPEKANKENEYIVHWHTGGDNALDPLTVRALDVACKQYGIVPPRLKGIDY